jgi:hypothetical protein
MRSFGQLCDLNIAATRLLLRTQARAASALGWPDVSGAFEQVDERVRNVFATGAEQFAKAAELANEAAADLQRQVGRVVETQAVTVAESLQQGLEQWGEQASEGLREITEAARDQAGELERASQEASREVRNTLQEQREREQRERRPGQGQPGQGQPQSQKAA